MTVITSRRISRDLDIQVGGVAPPLPRGMDGEIEAAWRAAQEEYGGTLHNGRLFSVDRHDGETIRGYFVEYRWLVAQRADPALFEVLRVRPLAISGVVETHDGIVFGRRAQTVTQGRGLWELVPSGGVEPGCATGGVIDVVRQAVSELEEELGLREKNAASLAPFAFVEDAAEHVLDIGIAIQVPLSFDQLTACHAGSGSGEYVELRALSLIEARNWAASAPTDLLATSRALLDLYV